MKLNLVVTIPNGYAEREFIGFEKILKDKCTIITNENVPQDVTGDFWIVADYYFNPFFDDKKVSKELKEYINKLPKERTGIYYSDRLFKFSDPSKFENWSFLVLFATMFEDFDLEKEKDSMKIFENIDKNSKKICKMDIPSIAMMSYENPGFVEKKYDFGYIINSKILERKRLLDYMYKLDKYDLQLGNLPITVSEDKDVREFVTHREELDVETKYEDRKVFGVDYLRLNGESAVTINISDDNNSDFMFPMRFHEAISTGTLSMVDRSKDPKMRLYGDYPLLSRYLYFSGSLEFLQKFEIIMKNEDLYYDLVNESLLFLQDYLSVERLEKNIWSSLNDL